VRELRARGSLQRDLPARDDPPSAEPEAVTRALLVLMAMSIAACGAAQGGPSADPLVGPRDVPPPLAAVIAPSFEALAAMVADPSGPREIALEATTYRGDLVIARPVAIFGRKGTILEGTGTTSVVTVSGADVTLSDVTLRRSGRKQKAEDAGFKVSGTRIRIAHARIEDTLFGVSLLDCKQCEIEGVHVIGREDDPELRGDGIKLWEAHGSKVLGCLVERARDIVVWYTRHALLDGNVVRNSRYGTHFMYAHDAVVRRSRLENNVVGIFVMYSVRMTIERNLLAGARGAAGMGLGFKDSDAITVRGNWLVANTTGTHLDNTPRTPAQPVVFEGNVIALNDVALRFHNSLPGLSFRGNDLRQNPAIVEIDGGGDAHAVVFRRNHYSDYEGYDLDADGIGDVPYEVTMLSTELTGARPAVKYFHGTAALALIDAVAHAVPLLAPKKLLSDPEPLVSAPRIEAP
jgi:nitrous oxidase accessory protein